MNFNQTRPPKTLEIVCVTALPLLPLLQITLLHIPAYKNAPRVSQKYHWIVASLPVPPISMIHKYVVPCVLSFTRSGMVKGVVGVAVGLGWNYLCFRGMRWVERRLAERERDIERLEEERERIEEERLEAERLKEEKASHLKSPKEEQELLALSSSSLSSTESSHAESSRAQQNQESAVTEGEREPAEISPWTLEDRKFVEQEKERIRKKSKESAAEKAEEEEE